MLTGKTKEDFIEWFRENINQTLDLTIIEDFYLYPFSMQWGVFVDFFDNKKIYINDEHNRYGNTYQFFIDLEIETQDIIGVGYLDRNESRKSAIKKANKIYNQARNKAKTPHS